MYENPFLGVVEKAIKLKWCVQVPCTTCGCKEYRQALHKLGGDLGGPLANALTDLDLKKITEVPNWDDFVAIALMDLPLQNRGILSSWLVKAQESDIDFLDVILFKIIRWIPVGDKVRTQWISRCSALAVKTKNPSLIESLVLVLGQETVDSPELLAIASKLAEGSSQMRRVMLNACGLKISPRVSPQDISRNKKEDALTGADKLTEQQRQIWIKAFQQVRDQKIASLQQKKKDIPK